MFLEKTSRQCGARMGGDTQNPNTRIQRPLGWSQVWERAPPPNPTPTPCPTRPGNLPSQGKALTGWHPGNQCQAVREGTHPPPGTRPSPLPQPQRMQQFTLWIYYCSQSCPPPPWEEPAAWQPGRNLLSPCGCQHRTLSPLSLLVSGSDHSGAPRQPRPT